MLTPEDDMPLPRDRRRAIVVIAGAVLAVVVVIAVVNGNAVNRFRALTTPHRPIPVVATSPVPGDGCQPNQLQLEGAFNSCADEAGSDAPACLPGASGNVFGGQGHLHDKNYRYILYVEIDGGYHGPGTYPLVPWPHVGLDARDGIAKVAVREVESGALWQSTAGSITIGQDQGFVFALLSAPGDGPTADVLKISGEWYCG